MSADNGIYIARFKTLEGHFEYRVAHCIAVENCNKDYLFPVKLTEAYRVRYFGNSEVYITLKAAREQAVKLEEEYSQDYPIEYGICPCNYDDVFPTMTMDEAIGYYNKYWEEHREKL